MYKVENKNVKNEISKPLEISPNLKSESTYGVGPFLKFQNVLNNSASPIRLMVLGQLPTSRLVRHI